MKENELVIPGINHLDTGSLLYVTTYKYYCLLVKNLLEGTCPFCKIDQLVNKVLYENESWRAWINPVPGKKHQAIHLVIPHRHHITDIVQLNPNDGANLVKVFQWARLEFEIAGGGVMMRFGDPRLNAGTIRHLHVNIQVPDGTGKLDITLAKDKEKVEWHHKLVRVFEKMRLGTPFEHLKPDEKQMVQDRLD